MPVGICDARLVVNRADNQDGTMNRKMRQFNSIYNLLRNKKTSGVEDGMI